MSIDLTGWMFLLFIAVFIPLTALKTVRRVRTTGGKPSRGQFLFSVFYLQGITLFLALAAARFNWIPLFPAPSFEPEDALLALAFLGSAVGTLPWRWRWKSEGEKRQMLWILPHSRRDLVWWFAVSLTAGIVEEIVYRGVAVALLQRLLGSWWAAVAISVAVFSVSHAVQGWRAVAAIVPLSVAAHLVVRATGDLYTMMAIHVVYDVLAGLVLLRLARRDGLLAVT